MLFLCFLAIFLIVCCQFTSAKIARKSTKTDCAEHKHAEISPGNVYIMIISNIAVDESISAYNRYYKSVATYSRKHGYNLEIVSINGSVSEEYNQPKGKRLYHYNNTAGMMKYNKPNVMLDTLQRLHTGSSCEDKYVVYLDIDVYIVDLNQKIEDLIKNGNIENSRECHLLAQDAPTTINTGVLIFKVSSFSIEFIKKWIKLQRWYTIYEKIKWQDEQGWLQYTYLLYIAGVTKQKLPLDCTLELKGPYEIEANIRNKCYAYNLHHLGLSPGNRNTGNICLLSGLSRASRINLHDWEGVARYNEGKYSFQPSLYNTQKQRKPSMQQGSCLVDGGWTYHGKDAGILTGLSNGHITTQLPESSSSKDWIPSGWLRHKEWVART